MFTKTVPYKNFEGKPRNKTVRFNLEIREIVKLMPEFKQIFDWQESLKGDERELSTQEVVDFYNAFEAVLLASWGELSEDGEHFRKAGRYDFEESAVFAACMEQFVSDPAETGKLLEGIMPEGMEELIKKADTNLQALADDPNTEAELQARIAQLQAQLQQGQPAVAAAE